MSTTSRSLCSRTSRTCSPPSRTPTPKPRPGKAYGQRTDLPGKLPVTTVPGQPYGQAAAQARAQQAVPMGTPPQPQVEAQGQPQGEPQVAPGSLGDLLRPTDRPAEPVTAG